MIFMFIISTLFAQINVYQSLQKLYTQQQTQSAYKSVMQCISSFQNKSLSENCWSYLKAQKNNQYKNQILQFLQNNCSQFSFSEKQMLELGCAKKFMLQRKIKDYKSQDIYIDN